MSFKTVHSIHKYFTGNEFIILENHEKIWNYQLDKKY